LISFQIQKKKERKRKKKKEKSYNPMIMTKGVSFTVEGYKL